MADFASPDKSPWRVLPVRPPSAAQVSARQLDSLAPRRPVFAGIRCLRFFPNCPALAPPPPEDQFGGKVVQDAPLL